jgi:16S rRNA (adenine(1408)-N(1))-methyltransferase
VHIDVGTGDGAYVYRSARAEPSHLFIGVDANGDAMAERSRRAAAKAARGGLVNVLYVRANVESLPEELEAIADRVTVLFAWGSLLAIVASADPRALRPLRAIC